MVSMCHMLPDAIIQRKLDFSDSARATDYGESMTPIDTKSTLWRNLSALMRHHWGKENLARLSREARIGLASCTRLKEQQTSIGLELLESVAQAFGLQAWQLLIPNLDPSNPPVFVMSDSERQFYERMNAALREVACGAPSHPYATANGAHSRIRNDRRVGGRRSTDRH